MWPVTVPRSVQCAVMDVLQGLPWLDQTCRFVQNTAHGLILQFNVKLQVPLICKSKYIFSDI